MIILYSYSIIDFQGESIIYSSKKYVSAKQAAFLATNEKNSIPPAGGIRIHKHVYDRKQIAKIINDLP
tara:strand:+ start:182 stop:385 length:204 start_codon:yes stop_codon:yes gene_type:complete